MTETVPHTLKRESVGSSSMNGRGGGARSSAAVNRSGGGPVLEQKDRGSEKGRSSDAGRLGEKGKLTDLELLVAFREGDERAFAELYVRRKSEIYTFCMRMLDGDPDAASDAFQETFIKVYEKAASFREGTNVLGWLYMIARNTCLNVHRAKRPLESLDVHFELRSQDRRLEPEFREEQTFLRQMLEQAIMQLPREFREPFILREFDGFSYAEIAKLTSATLGVTKIRIHRAKQKMRELLRPYVSENGAEDFGGGDSGSWTDGGSSDEDDD